MSDPCESVSSPPPLSLIAHTPNTASAIEEDEEETMFHASRRGGTKKRRRRAIHFPLSLSPAEEFVSAGDSHAPFTTLFRRGKRRERRAPHCPFPLSLSYLRAVRRLLEQQGREGGSKVVI